MFKRHNSFDVGQRIRIRSIEDMEAEYGLADHADYLINCPGPFFNKSDMSMFCGATAIIDSINNERVTLNAWQDSNGEQNSELEHHSKWWIWTIHMIEPVEISVSFDENAFNRMLGVDNVS